MTAPVGGVLGHGGEQFVAVARPGGRLGWVRDAGLAGSDGSSVVFESTVKVTMKPDGTAVVDRQSSTCR